MHARKLARVSGAAVLVLLTLHGAQDPLPDPLVEEAKPYERVIKGAKSDRGVFTVHRSKDKLYYEIPETEFGKEFLWVSRIARTTLGVGYGGQTTGSHVVRWERRDNRVLLRSVSYEVVADAGEPIARAVQDANNDAILKSFPVEATGPKNSVVIDVTGLFTTEVPEFSARGRLRARSFDGSRSFLERVAAFPSNIEVEATQTYTGPAEGKGPAGSPGMRAGSATVLMHYSMVKLPERPMMPRLFDERVGYFHFKQIDFGKDEHRAPSRTYIKRWRLEKQDPEATLSEPVKPITFYIDPATPRKWIPYIKRGVEKWQSAFEDAGFRNAILAKDPPDDTNWSPDDVRYSVIRWLPSTVENAQGPHIADPRTGEILEADIQFHHNVMNLTRDWYFLQVGPLDPRARKLPLPDDLMGSLIEYVTAHEVGHTLGLQHNMKASSLYPAEKLRDPQWLKTMGHTPTIMDYARFNYVAQPEDGIDPADLIPGIGPYDRWAIRWGYAPVAGAKSPEQERELLDAWAREQDRTPWLRFSTAKADGSDPGELTEAVGDSDAVYSTGLGIKNLARVSDLVLDATTTHGESYDELERVYSRLLGQWTTEMGHVAAIVGGLHSQQKHGGQEGVRFEPVPWERQAAAVKFLNDHAFVVPDFLIKPEILRRIEPAGALRRIRSSQSKILAALLQESRIARLVEQEALDGEHVYRATDFLSDLHRGIWSELKMPGVRIDAYRRNLQRSQIGIMAGALSRRSPASEEARSLYRGELRSIAREIESALDRVADRATQYHLWDIRDEIRRAIEPGAQGGQLTTAPTPSAAEEETAGCWHDYAIE